MSLHLWLCWVSRNSYSCLPLPSGNPADFREAIMSGLEIYWNLPQREPKAQTSISGCPTVMLNQTGLPSDPETTQVTTVSLQFALAETREDLWPIIHAGDGETGMCVFLSPLCFIWVSLTLLFMPMEKVRLKKAGVLPHSIPSLIINSFCVTLDSSLIASPFGLFTWSVLFTYPVLVWDESLEGRPVHWFGL